MDYSRFPVTSAGNPIEMALEIRAGILQDFLMESTGKFCKGRPN